MRNERELLSTPIPQTVDATRIYRWLVDMNFESQDINVGVLKPNEGVLPAYKLGIGRVIAEGVPVWNEVTQLLVRNSVHEGSSYSVDPSKRVLIAQLSPYFSTDSLVDCFGISNEQTCRRITTEVASTITYILGKNNDFIPWGELNEYGKEQLIKFAYSEKERLSLGPILARKDVKKVLRETPALEEMLTRQLQDGCVSLYLKELGFESLPKGLNSIFAQFSRSGYDESRAGVHKWTRNALFKKWLNSVSHTNSSDVNMPQLLTPIALKLFSYELVPRRNNRDLASNVRNFLRYLMIADSGGSDPIYYYNYLGDEALPETLHRFGELVVKGGDYHLGAEDIRKKLFLSNGPARGAYYAGVSLLDYLLSAKSTTLRNKVLENLSPSPTYRGYEGYKSIVKEVNETTEF